MAGEGVEGVATDGLHIDVEMSHRLLRPEGGPLFIPSTPAAARRATLLQTVFGGAAATPQRPPAERPPRCRLPLPNLPEIG